MLGTNGCASQRCLPHGGFAWAARLHPQVKRVFASLFDVSPAELSTGTDVVFWSAAGAEAAPDNAQWLHVDQNHCSGLTHLCAQGILYIWPSTTENTSTTAVWPGSHREVYQRLMRDREAISKGRLELGSQWVHINSLQDYSERDSVSRLAVAGTRRAPCPAGSLLLFDSRTIHQGWAGGPRLAQPVCWEPTARRDEAARLRKLYCCAAGVATSHSSSEGRVHGMAWMGAPRYRRGNATKPALQVTMPSCVRPDKETEWQALQGQLWVDKADPKENSTRVTPALGRAIEAILKPEVLASL